MQLEQLLTQIKKYEIRGNEYYKMEDLLKSVENKNEVISSDETIIMPFYVETHATMELYDYECSIIMTTKMDEMERYFLEKTGKIDLSDIDVRILEKLKKCCINMEKGKRTDISDSLIKYLDFVLNSAEIKERVTKRLGKFNKENIYIEIY